MARRLTPTVAFIVGGFLTNLFAGFINPLYMTRVMAGLDERVVALGGLFSAAFPVLVGIGMERRALFRRLYALLPAIMAVEVALTGLVALLCSDDLAAFYLAGMLLMGILGSAVVYLLQRTREAAARRDRTSFDRRVAVADGLGYLAGSALAVAGARSPIGPAAIGALGTLQTGIVYGLLVYACRKPPRRRRLRREPDQEGHPRGAPRAPEDRWTAAARQRPARLCAVPAA